MLQIEYTLVTSGWYLFFLHFKNTLAQNENFTLFIMGFTIPEIKTPVPPNAGNEIQSFVGMLNFISWGVSLLKKSPQKALDLSDLRS